MENIQSSQCVNCQAEVGASYCNNCGQKASIQRLRWGTLFAELNQRVLGLDNKFAKTVKDLTIRPGIVSKAFINGNRTKYIGPVGYFFVIITIYVLLISMLEVDMVEFSKEISGPFSSHETSRDTDSFQRLMMSNMKLLSFILVPFFAWGAYIVFRKKGYNVLESAVMILYSHAHPLFLSIIGLLIYKFADISLNPYILPLSLLYFGYVCTDFYQGNKIWNFVKGILSYLIGLLLFMLLIIIVIVLVSRIDSELLQTIFPRKN